MRQLLSTTDVANKLRCSAPHVRHLMDRGLLPYVEIPTSSPRRKMRRVDSESLDRWIVSNSVAAEAES